MGQIASKQELRADNWHSHAQNHEGWDCMIVYQELWLICQASKLLGWGGQQALATIVSSTYSGFIA